MAKRMMDKGVYVVAFSYPVVPKGKARIRTQLSAAVTREDIRYVVDCFRHVKEDMGMQNNPKVSFDTLGLLIYMGLWSMIAGSGYAVDTRLFPKRIIEDIVQTHAEILREMSRWRTNYEANL
jgi:hypothetical protein